VGAIAIGGVGGVFALTKPRRSDILGREGFGSKLRSLVRTVAERLIRGLSARAKIIRLPRLQFDFDRIPCRDGWLTHGGNSADNQ